MLALGLSLLRFRPVNVVITGGGEPSTNFRISPANSNYRILGGLNHQWWNDETNGFHGWFPNGPAGEILTAWGDKDATASSPDADALDFGANQDFRFVMDATGESLFEKWNPVTAGFHAPWIDGPDNGLYLVWSVKDVTANGAGNPFTTAPADGNFRMSAGGLLQLKHATSGKFHTVWGRGQNGAVEESIGAGEV